MKNVLFVLFLLVTMSLFAQNYLLDFDGVDDYIAVAGANDINTAGPYTDRTIEMWFKADTLITDSLQTLYEEGGKINGFHLYIQSDSLYAGAWCEKSPQSWDGTWYHHEILADKWYHVALVLSNGTSSLSNNKLFAYINGYEFSTGNKQGTQIVKHEGDIHIGRHGNTKIHTGDLLYTAGYFHGRLDEIRIWSTARTQTEIQDNMYDEISTSSTGLIAYWNLDDGSGTTATDVTSNTHDGTLNNMDPSTDWISGDLPSEPTVPVFMFSEISDNDTGAADTGFIEIYNPASGSRDIGGYKIILGTNPTGTNFIADSPEVSYTIPSGTSIAGRGVLTVGNGATRSNFNTAWGTSLTTSTYVAGSSSLVIASGKAYSLDDGSKSTVDYSPEINTNERRNVEENDLWADPESSSNGTPGTKDGEQDLPLPVVLSEFTTIFANNSALLSWITMSETNNSYWNIYRSPSSNFGQSSIVNGEPIQGQGTTSDITHYSYRDNIDFNEGDSYFYWIQSVNYAGESALFGPVQLNIPEQDNPEPPTTPEQYGLIQNFPNPFNPATEIHFTVNPGEKVTLSIFNIKGEKVKDLYSQIAKGDDKVVWNGYNNSGKKVTSGIYLCKLTTPKKSFTKQMLLLK